MSFKSVCKYLDNNFISWGWLIPAFFPVLEAIGRGPLNTCLAIYLAWGMTVLFRRGFGGERRTVFLYFVLVTVFGLSLINAVSIYKGAHAWVKYSFVILTYFMTRHALLADRNNWKRQFKCLAAAGILTVLALVIRGGSTSDWHYWVPVRGMFERNLPFLLPFLLFATTEMPSRVGRLITSFAACGVFLVIIIYSGGRSALVGFVASLALYGVLGFRMRIRTVVFICVLAVLSAALLGGPKGVLMTRYLSVESPLDIDSLSTGRTALWRQALAHPPANQALGVGMNNVRYYDEVVTIKNVAALGLGGVEKVKGLHNFIIDLWYETGFSGLITYLVFMASFLIPPLYNWKSFPSEQKMRIAPLLSAVLAIFAAGLTSISYTSPQLSGYLFFLLASLTALGSDCMGCDKVRAKTLDK